MNNPFVTNGYAGEHYFCDRVEETQTLVDLLTNENNVALIAPRRLGKTDLIKHTFAQRAIREHYYTFVIDIYATTSLQELVKALGKSIVESLTSMGKRMIHRFVDIVTSLRADITFDIFGQPSWGMSVGHVANPEMTLDEIFRFLEQTDRPCLVAIDEFQQITTYVGQPNVEANLRTYIRQCRNANFIFSGSQRHLMDKIFTSPSRPLYQSVTLMNLQPLSLVAYRAFASGLFAEAHKTLPSEVADAVYEQFQGVTAYMQRVMNTLYQRTLPGESCTVPMIAEVIDYHLDLAHDSYETLMRQIPTSQRNVLIAIACEGHVKNVNSGSFTRKYRLPSTSSVSSAVKGLLTKDLVTEDKEGYQVYDQLLALWIRRRIAS